MVINLNDENFKTEVEDASGLILVDFWAPWCGPCQALGPIIEQLAEELEGKVKVCKVNVDKNQVTANRYGVSSIPTVLIFKDGNVVEKLVGYMPKESYLEAVSRHFS